jgi:hypothetical protein
MSTPISEPDLSVVKYSLIGDVCGKLSFLVRLEVLCRILKPVRRAKAI